MVTKRAWSPAAAFGGVFLTMAALLLVRSHDLFTRVIHEDSDFAANSIRAMQAKNFELLVGNYSRMRFSHPGPVFLYVQGFGEWLFHDVSHLVSSPWNGQAIAILLLNSALLAAAVIVLSHRWRSWTAVGVGAGAVLLYITLSHPILPVGYDDTNSGLISSTWMPNVYFAPFLLLLVAATSVAAGRAGDLWALALAGGLLIHGHVEFLLFVPVLSLLALVALLVQRRWRLAKREWIPFAAIYAVFAMPIVVNVIRHWPGEFAKYFAYSASSQPHTLSESARFVLVFFAAPPFWASALAVGLTVACVLTALRVDRPLLTGVGFAVVATILMLYYAQTAIDDLDAATYVGQFYCAVPALLFLLLLLSLHSLVPAARLRRGLAGLLVVAGLATAAVSPAMVNRRTEIPHIPAALDAIRAHTHNAPAVLVLAQNAAWPEAASLVVHGTRQGMRMCVANENYEFLFTAEFICTAEERTHGKQLLVTRHDEAPPEGELIAPVGRSDIKLP